MDGTTQKDEHRFSLPSSALPLLKNEYTEVVDALAEHCANLDARVSELSSKLCNLEEELQQEKVHRRYLEAALQAAHARSEASEDVQSQFLNNMSHELRTPLNGILGMAQLMLDLPLSHVLKDYTEAILQSGRSLDGIISNLLDFSRLTQGDFPFDVSSFALLAGIEDVVLRHTEAAFAKGISSNFLADRSLFCEVEADQIRVQQILDILLDNAVKFTHQGNVILSASIQPAGDGDDTVAFVFSIYDTGIGIDASHLDLVYEPFWQADRSNTRAYGGVGMGLALCKKLVSLMGGNITIKSRLHEGTTCTVALPLPKTPRPIEEDLPVFHKLRIGLYRVTGTNKHMLREYLSWWHIEPQEIPEKDADARALSNLDLIITSEEEQGPAFLLDLLHKQDSSTNQPLVIGLTSPSKKLNPLEKKQYDILLLEPILHRPLKETLTFAFETLASRPAGQQVYSPASIRTHTASKVLLIEPNKINQKILIHMFHSLGLEVEALDSLDDMLHKQEEKGYLAILVNTISEPKLSAKVLHELKQSLSMESKDKLIGIKGRDSDEPAEAYVEAGISHFLTLPTSIDQMRSLLLET